MATPHVAGVAALFLETNPTASPATVTAAIINNSTLNKVTNAGTGSPNRLLFSQLTGGPPPTPTPTPTPPPAGESYYNRGFESALPMDRDSGRDYQLTGQRRGQAPYAWLDGYGTTHTILVPTITVPAALRP